MASKIRLTKKSIIILGIVVVILSGALGYLIWRVNQPDTTAPTDSEAAGGAGACCISGIGCVAGWKCDTSQSCTDSEPAYVGGYGPDCGRNASGQTLKCRTSFLCSNISTHTCTPASPLGRCVKEDDSGGPTEGECKDVKCEWPLTLMSGRVDASQEVCRCEECTGKKADNPYSCTGNPPQCNPPGCSGGLIDCGTSGDHEDGNGCEKQTSLNCTAYHPDCNNPSVTYRYCKPNVPVVGNVCDGGTWIVKPSGSVNYGEEITFSAKAQDIDGIKKESIIVKKGDLTLPVCSTGQTIDCIKLTEAATETTITGTLSNTSKKLSAGEYTIGMTWKDKKDASSVACSLNTAFTVLPQQTNPNWSITKSAVEKCIDDKTENPKAELTYTITVKNTGDAVGTISKIEDILDTKVMDSFVEVSTITSPGVYSKGKILWNFTSSPLSFTAGQSRVYTYKLLLNKESFETYSNVVTLTPVGSDQLVASANVTAACDIVKTVVVPNGEVPATGLFDSTISKIVVGFVLLVLGGVIYNLPNDSSFKERERFEKKVASK